MDSIIILSDDEETNFEPKSNTPKAIKTTTGSFHFFFNREHSGSNKNEINNTDEREKNVDQPDFDPKFPTFDPIEINFEPNEPFNENFVLENEPFNENFVLENEPFNENFVLGNEPEIEKTQKEKLKNKKRPPKRQSGIENLMNGPSTSTSEETGAPPKKTRMKRSKEEIAAEKRGKAMNAIQREMQASKNSKCEQYLYCYVNRNVLAIEDQLQSQLTHIFAERKISDQITFTDQNFMKICWKRKKVDGMIDGGQVLRLEEMDLEGVFCTVLDGQSFLALVKNKDDRILDYISEKIKEFGHIDPQMTIIVFGKHGVHEKALHSLIADAFERFRVQFRFVDTPTNFAYLLAQMHRALAKVERKLQAALSTPLPILQTEKGITQGPGLVLDWWTRMLSHMYRLSEEAKRALVQKYPNPFELINLCLSMPGAAAIDHISKIQAGNGIKIGPVFAQRIFTMLTSTDGTEILKNS